MRTWTEVDERYLLRICKKYLDSGMKLHNALSAASAKLGRTFASCESKYKRICHLTNVSKRVNVKWDRSEDLFLLREIKKTRSIQLGCISASKVLKQRTYDSCRRRWDKLKIETKEINSIKV